MTRKLLLLACAFALLAGETAYFGGRAVAGIMRVRGQRAFFRNDQVLAWRSYRKALTLGGDKDQVETDMAGLLLFGLDQLDAGVKVRTALAPADSLRTARDLVSKRLTATPYRADLWSLASNVYEHMAQQQRLRTSIDLSALSEDPTANFLAEERLAVAALRKASDLEPNNYIYHDLLTEWFLDRGSPHQAAPYCRRAVAAGPQLSQHLYLMRSDLAPEMIEAALGGFEDAVREHSFIAPETIECEAGRLLTAHGEQRRALEYFRRAVARKPDYFDARFELGLACYQTGDFPGAIEQFKVSANVLPDSPWPQYYLGLSHISMGNDEDALPHLRLACEKGGSDPRFRDSFGGALERVGQPKEAERQFVAAANLNPNSAQAWRSLLDFYVRQRDMRAVSETCFRLLALRPPLEPAIPEVCAHVNGLP